ncbi:MAG: cation:proton antiporter, partial [Ruminococcaceae bacterium]|nr:cation:proton antiporter [Oscillospiraceae bacterium]
FAGLFSGKLMKKFKLPNVTGYIIFGLIIGPYVLGILPEDVVSKMTIISDVALGFIAFSIGSEFKLSYLKKIGKSPVVIAFCEGFGATLLVDLALVLAGCDIKFSLVLGAIASATAPAATIMVVKQYKAKGPVTDTLLPVVAIDDAVALIAFGISFAVAKIIGSTGNVDILSVIISPVIEIIGGLLFGAVLGFILSALIKWFTGRGNRLSVAIAMVCLCVGISVICGFSSLLACMAMGAIFINTSKRYNELFQLTDRFTPPLFLLFFVVSGAELNVGILPSVGVIGIVYIIVRVLGKMGGASLGAIIGKASPEVKKYLGPTLIPQAGVAIGLSMAAVTVVPEFGANIRVIILCATIIYELVGPVITKITLIKAGEIKE